MIHVPDLRTASRRADWAAAVQWRAERRGQREAGTAPGLRMALVTDGSDRGLAAQVRRGGAEVIGLLAPEVFESLAWAAEAEADHGYSALDALVSDAVDAACLDLPLAESCRSATLLLESGVSVVLARPDTPDRSDVRVLLDAAAAGNCAATLALRTRAWPSIAAAAGVLPALGAVSQLTVFGWPASRAARAELCDLVRRLCGEVVAVCASAAAMPAHELAPAAPVTLSLLTATGTTVVVHESPSSTYYEARLTLIAAAGRAVVGQRMLQVSDMTGVREVAVAAPADPVRLAVEGLGGDLAGGVNPAAGLGDLLAAARVLELAVQSYESDKWVEA